jgi:Fic family protein
MRYNWQQKTWPNFQYKIDGIEDLLYDFAQRTGRISGVLEGLSESEQTETMINLMVSEAIKTSEIEGDYLSRNDVMSSIRRNLGLNPELPLTKDKRAEGVAELILAVRNDFLKPLSNTMLFDWHTMLMKGNNQIQIGRCRTHSEPMQIVSGGMGREVVHFEAPPSSKVPLEMDGLIKWFNQSETNIKKPILRAAIAHLYFETIHPFEDGNGRIGRAVAEKALSQSIGRPVLFSLSKSIESNKNNYYDALKAAQRSNEITDWINYFVKTVLDAQIDAEQEIEFTLKKTKFFDNHKDVLNERQQKVVRRMLEEGHQGFEGGMNARKYVSLAKTSKATATRDLQDLVAKGIFKPIGGGRSTRYEIDL